jgi:hypothetical protein
MRSYQELLSDEPAWPELEVAARKSGRVTVLSCDAVVARACLEGLQVSTRSTLGAIAHETGGLLVDRGWLRVFGSGHARLRRALGEWNRTLGVSLGEFLLVADDVIGGAFAINGGGLGRTPGNVFYFAPDRLAWEDLELGHSAFMHWVFEGDLELFYESMRWPGWEQEVEQVAGDQTLSLAPPPWTREGKDLSKVSRRAVAAREAWTLQQELARQLGPP